MAGQARPRLCRRGRRARGGSLKKLEFYWGTLDNNPNVPPLALLAAPALRKVEELAVSIRDLGAVWGAAKKTGAPLKKLSFLQRYYLVYRVDADLENEHITVCPIDDRNVDVRGHTCAPLFAVLDSLPAWKRTIDPRLVFDAPTRARLDA